MRFKSLFFIFPILLLGTGSIKADPVIDSLMSIIKSAKNDTSRIRLYNELSSHFVNSKPDTAIYFAKKALEFIDKSKKSNQDVSGFIMSQESDSYTNIGNCYKTLADYEKAVDYYKKSLDIRNQNRDMKGVADNYIDIGIIKSLKGNYESAEEYYKKAVEIQNEIKDEPGLAKAYRNIGNVYYYQGETNQSIEYYQKSLVLSEKINDLESVSRCYNNIGMIYSERALYNWAEEYFSKSLVIKKKTGDKRGIATAYNNLGDVYFKQQKYSEANDFYSKSFKIREEVKDKRGMAISLLYIGRVFAKQHQFVDAERNYKASLKINEEITDLEQQSVVLMEMAAIFLDTKKYSEGIAFASKAIEIGKSLKTLPRLRDAYEVMAKIYEKQNNIPEAYKYYKEYINMKDSIYSDDEHKLIVKETKYKLDKKQKEIENANLKFQKQEADRKNMRMKMILLLIGLAAMLILAFVLFKNYKQKTKANKLLEEQKREIELRKAEVEAHRDLVMEKNEQVLAAKKEIEDSIIYAKNIQHAVLPSEELRQEILPEHFIFWRPRNIVSGDFFWMKRLKNFVVITIADCTGHGVPGAFMSMLGLMFLNEIVTTRSLDSSGLILNKLREKIKKSLHQSGKEGEAKDGMDISFFIIDTDSYEMQFSGAFNPLFVLREKSLITDISKIESDNIKACYSQNEDCKAVLFEIKADRQPIAIYSYEKSFTTNQFQLQKEDCIYSFTDGYPDQFGGSEGKKLNAKRFKDMFLSIYHLPIDEQYKQVEKHFYDWMGPVEQVDDVLLMGLRIG
jgi:tetratricopeptide (TPR) repeat protein